MMNSSSTSRGTKTVDVSKRFVNLSENPTEYVMMNENKLTRKKTNSHIQLLKSFLLSKNELRKIEAIPYTELDEHLSQFILSVRKTDGDDYEPVTLRSMISSIDRYLKEKKYGTSVVRGEAFSCTMQSLSSKSKTLRQAGKGNKPNVADALTDRDINRLYEANQLGTTNPRQLTNTLWLNHMTHFGMRARQEHRNLCWGDLRLGFDDEVELEYMEFNERVTKTRTGEDIKNIRRQKPRMYARPDSTRCPITAYKIFRDHRPTGYSNPDDPFYLSAVTNTFCPAVTEKWYLRGPIGANTLGDLLPRMANNANLPGLEDGKRITNTSARKRLCQKMTESSIPDDQAILITGHKTTASLNSYRILSKKQQMSISHTVAATGFSPPASPVRQIQSSTATVSSSQVIESSSEVKQTRLAPSLFHGAVISGGVFNISLNINKNPSEKSSELTESDEELLHIKM